MGIATWCIAGLLAFAIARAIPLQRRRNRASELFAALVMALLGGVAATVMDFGGWRVIDVRAVIFALAWSLAAIAILRIVNATMAR
ncbi:MAG: hypothetical protein WBX15_11175 [Thermoanaerobaculia bacterium]